MLIAIASDLHDNLANWEIFNEQIKKQGVNILLFCGDLCNDDTLRHVAKSFFGEIYIIAGNGELYHKNTIEKLSNVNHLGKSGSINLKKLKIGLVHEPNLQADLEKKFPQLDYIFYGHTHRPWIENRKTLIMANPGTLGGMFYPATYATLNIVSREIKLITLF